MTSGERHISVLGREAVEWLAPRDGGIYVDATFGAGGYSRAILDVPGTRVIGIDRDRTAIAGGFDLVDRSQGRLELVQDRFSNLANVCAAQGVSAVDGVVMDVGVSSMQLDQPERGFSYSQDAPLDMRMDTEAELTAAEIINSFDRRELTDILRRFGEERFAHRIAGLIVEQRSRAPFSTTAELVELIYRAIPAPARRTGGHPAKRTFQALRIAVNAELDSLEAALPAALDATRAGGRVVVMAYQSLEDRIVKATFSAATASRSPEGLPIELPGYEPEFAAVIRGAEKADAIEIERNPRSAPVRLRAVERVGPVSQGRGEGRQ